MPEPPPGEILTALTRAGARLDLFAGRLRWYSTVASTNDVAAQCADRGEAEGLIVAADGQTAGRGRRGRQWSSPPAAGLYASVVFRPAPHVAPLITVAAGVALVEGIEGATGLRPTLKWPNDIHVGPRKLAGILAEARGTGTGVQYVVVGFGINLVPAAYPAEVAARATSVESEIGRPVDRGIVLVECLSALAARYRDLCEARPADVIAAWRRRAAGTFGRRIEWDAPGGVRQGTVEDIDACGALIVRSGDGRLRIISGEVRWRS